MNHPRLFPCLALALALVLSGCAQPQAPATPEPTVSERPPLVIIRGVRPADPADEAFRDLSQYHAFSEAMLIRELAKLENSSVTSPYIDLRRLVLLWLLGHPESAPRIDALVNQLIHHPDPRVAATVSLLNRAIAGQRRSNERTAQLEAKLESKLAEAQRRNEQLTAKIQALKAIEKDLQSRSEPKPEPAAASPSQR